MSASQWKAAVISLPSLSHTHTHTRTHCQPVTGTGTREKGNNYGRRLREGKNVKGGEHVSAFVRLPRALVFAIRYTERKEKFDSSIIFSSVHHILSVRYCSFFLFFSIRSPSILFRVQKTTSYTGLDTRKQTLDKRWRITKDTLVL